MMLLRKLGWQVIKFLIRLLFPNIRQLSTQDLAAWLQQSDIEKSDTEKPLLLDARTEAEYKISHLQNAQLVGDRPEVLENKITDLATPIVVYCSVGYRSSAIARQLQSLGYQNVFNLSGSIFQWANENRPVYREGKRVNQIHPYHKFWKFLLTDNE
ncbi:rhodanese-like domain-containing protein [Pleurocapsales cyanobacterium LEGE 10410]|nr:rhodanese-like domain-containing protein [Pleurocapsales cyanobacterium LEGE 10410]